jgi:hypothetical protein
MYVVDFHPDRAEDIDRNFPRLTTYRGESEQLAVQAWVGGLLSQWSVICARIGDRSRAGDVRDGLR